MTTADPVIELDTTTAPPVSSPRRGPLSLLWQSLVEDAGTIIHGIFINKLAGSILLPRVLRFVIYRGFGMQFQTANVFYGARFCMRNVKLGKNTFVNTNVQFEDVAPIVIGDNCQIGMETLFVTSHHDYKDHDAVRAVHSLPITVGNHCWIGARATILPGVVIEDGCVIAAGAVVTKRCEAGGVYAGIPARRIGETGRARSNILDITDR